MWFENMGQNYQPKKALKWDANVFSESVGKQVQILSSMSKMRRCVIPYEELVQEKLDDSTTNVNDNINEVSNITLPVNPQLVVHFNIESQSVVIISPRKTKKTISLHPIITHYIDKLGYTDYNKWKMYKKDNNIENQNPLYLTII